MRGCAAARAIESRLADRLFDDPLAEVLAGPKALELGTQVASGKGSREVCFSITLTRLTRPWPARIALTKILTVDQWSLRAQFLSQQASFYGYSSADSNQPRKLGWVTLRTRYLDDALAKACAQFQGQPCQAVLLGAGMDARPWRLPSMHSVRSVLRLIWLDHTSYNSPLSLLLTQQPSPITT